MAKRRTRQKSENPDKPDKPKRKGKIAKWVDRYDLYLRSVQSPDHEVAFINQVYRKEFGKPAKVLREDFCGTFAVCCEWVKRNSDRHAIGVDLDPEPLQWGREHNLSNLAPAAQKRVKLLQDDVRKVLGAKADVIAAQNFSYWIFKTRQDLGRYFKIAYRNLKAHGVMVLDLMGGNESTEEGLHDRRKISEAPLIRGSPKRFTYIWDQARYDPITHDSSFYIHFRFKDGSKLKRAFEYHWRFWTIPEVRELLAEAGFKRTDVYWDISDDEDEDKYRKREHADNDPAWVAYVVAVK